MHTLSTDCHGGFRCVSNYVITYLNTSLPCYAHIVLRLFFESVINYVIIYTPF